MTCATPPEHILLICSTCQGTSAAKALRQAVEPDLPKGYRVRAVDCMAGCDHPITVGFQATGKASYLFGRIETAEDHRALAEFAAQYQASESGWTSATHRPAALYEKTLARLPALPRAMVSS